MPEHPEPGLAPAFLVGALLAFLLTTPAQALTVAVVPPSPTDLEVFTVVVSGGASCPSVQSVDVLPGFPGQVEIALTSPCLDPSHPFLFEVPVGPLYAGRWLVAASLHGLRVEVPLTVAVAPLQLDVDPPQPTVADNITLRVSGSASCPMLGDPRPVGRLISLEYSDHCPILPPSPSPFSLERELGALPGGDHLIHIADFEGRTIAVLPLEVLPDWACASGDTVLCLRDGRFRVEARWQTGDREGDAQTVPLSDRSGAFWFFSPDNVEIVVKVLDGCRRPDPSFWAFAAGLTNVGVQLTVTDNRTGEVWEHVSPPGAPFAPVLDTHALRTCP